MTGKHPHVRGEDRCVTRTGQKRLETPPRAWGGPVLLLRRQSTLGNTPTCVGRTHGSCAARTSPEKHPHVRGEDQIVASVLTLNKETPPRAWGGLARAGASSLLRRNTPTCVGRTDSSALPIPFPGKHPHVRGEDSPGNRPRGCPSETPPRAWGGRLKPLLDGVEGRNTPTCVGRTSRTSRSGSYRRKHPHVRGED